MEALSVTSDLFTYPVVMPSPQPSQQQDPQWQQLAELTMKVAIPTFVPQLLSILASPASKLDWKRQALVAMDLSLRNNPHHYQDVLQEFLWPSPLPTNNDARMQQQKQDLAIALCDLLTRPDAEASYCAVQLIHALLRSSSPASSSREAKQFLEEAIEGK